MIQTTLGKKIFTNQFLMGAKGDVTNLTRIYFQPNVKSACEDAGNDNPYLAKYQLDYIGSAFSDRAGTIEITVNTENLKAQGPRGNNYITKLNTDEFKYIKGDIVSESLSFQDIIAGEYKTDITFVFTTDRSGV